MKELIGSVVFIVSLLGTGSFALRQVHEQVRKAALEKSAKGMPSLTKMTKALRGENVK
jgi:hypothetical protein